MSATPIWRRYLRFWGPDPAADVEDEFAFHVQTRVDELVGQGMSPRDARDEALRGFGDIEQVKRTCRALAQGQVRAERRTEWWTGWRQDVRYAARQLRRTPMLTAVLVLTLAVGIGATVSVFSVVNAVLLRPLAYADDDRIVMLSETWKERAGTASIGHFHDWSEQGTVFEHTTAKGCERCEGCAVEADLQVGLATVLGPVSGTFGSWESGVGVRHEPLL